MNVEIKRITGIDDAIVSMFISKRTWTPELDDDIRKTCNFVLSNRGKPYTEEFQQFYDKFDKFNKWLDSLVKWGWKHTTMLRYINIQIMTEGIHRAGQDDIDSHAKRFNNRIVRSSTRLAEFGDEKSDYYKDKILSTDDALKILNISLPDTIEHNGLTYVRATNGYILENMKDNKDVKRGLYMLSIPSNFVSQIDLCEYAHVYKERGDHGTANPEVKEWAESVATQLEEWFPQFNRELLLKILN